MNLYYAMIRTSSWTIMFEAGKTMQTLMVDSFQGKNPNKFMASNREKLFLKNLGSIAKDWKLSFSYPFGWDTTSTKWRMHNKQKERKLNQ